MNDEAILQLREQIEIWRDGLNDLITQSNPDAYTATSHAETVRGNDMYALGVQVDGALREIALLQARRNDMTLEQTVVVSVLQHMEVGLSIEQGREEISKRLALFAEYQIGGFGPTPAEPTPQIPLPLPAPLVPPDELSDEEAAWYLSWLLEEFAQYKWPATIAGAKDHWLKWGKKQGRKWRADAPPPAFGPKSKDRPPELGGPF